jgi:uncharacterized protein YraI
MKHLRTLAFAATAMLASSTWASAQEAYTTGDVNMRAGPGSRYPVVTTIPEDRQVYIHGCLSNWDWCDVSWRRNRGWVLSDYLEALYRNRRVDFDEYRTFVDIPFVTFGFGYWDRYYRDRPWYDDWDHWHHRRDDWQRDHRRDDMRDNETDYRLRDRRDTRINEDVQDNQDNEGDRVQPRNRRYEPERRGQPENLPGRRCGTADADPNLCPEGSNRGRNQMD